MHENRDFVAPVNILTLFARVPFSWAAQHTTMRLDAIQCKKGTTYSNTCLGAISSGVHVL